MFGSMLSYRGIDLLTDVPSGVVDQEYDGAVDKYLDSYSFPSGIGQTVTFGPNPSEVTGFRALFTITAPNKSLPGLMRCAVFEENGSDKPVGDRLSGTPVVFSPYYAVDSAASSDTDYYFPLSGWTPTADTKYVFTLQFFDMVQVQFQTAANWIRVRKVNTDEYSGGVRTVSIPGYRYASELASYGSDWNAFTATDLSFTVYSVSGSTTGDDDSIRFRDAMNRRRYGGLFR
jgi:hypothetical protein